MLSIVLAQMTLTKTNDPLVIFSLKLRLMDFNWSILLTGNILCISSGTLVPPNIGTWLKGTEGPLECWVIDSALYYPIDFWISGLLEKTLVTSGAAWKCS